MVDTQVLGGQVERSEEILTPVALEFVADLHARFAERRDELAAARAARREEASRTGRLDFLDSTRDVRESEWTVAAAPADLADRRGGGTRPPPRHTRPTPPPPPPP